MRKIASPAELQNELRAVLAMASSEECLPSRTAIATRLRRLAARVAADDEEDEGSGLPVKKGKWTLWIKKDRATRWGYSLHNPQGGSSGTGSFTSAKAAFGHATSRVDWKGADQVYVVVAKWDTGKGDWNVTKQMWVDIPKEGPIPTPKLASEPGD